MDVESIRHFCLSLPRATEDIQWGDDLLFRVGGKIFAIIDLNPQTPTRLSFKCTPEQYAELIEHEGIIPAPYLARYHWVTLERLDILSSSELKRFIENSYLLVFDRLPRKVKAQLQPMQPVMDVDKPERRGPAR